MFHPILSSYRFQFIVALLKDIHESVKSYFFGVAYLRVLFLCDLVNCRCVSVQSFFILLKVFVATHTELDNFQLRSDWYTYVVLNCLPRVGKEIAEKAEADLDALLESIEKYLSIRKTTYMPLLKVWTNDEPHVQEEYLECLWAQVKNLQENKWQTDCVVKHHVAFDAVLCNALQHDLPSFTPPPAQVTDLPFYPLPRATFRMFDMSDCIDEGPPLPAPHCIDRHLIEQDLTWLIEKYLNNRKECAAALLNHSKKDSVPLHYVILEVIFGQMFRLPRSPFIELFYGSLMIELCKLQPNSMPQVLAQAAEMLYQRLDSMQVQCIDRFIDWFSYHLSNFQFRWSWEDWADCLTMNPLAPKQLFVQEVLQKCMRFSFHQRVLDFMPSSFAPLVPTKPTPNFKYTQEGSREFLLV
ncbi:unnamed protein product [Soboliphyme baturini]|uniref:Nuclear cap-binding protein subunit 1 n=1 Tax=Soboliphyme baturini TaxID=241478 RepID=A0A183J733_9BILA|nr:unnamed protein product [Soboliphyme baturini]